MQLTWLAYLLVVIGILILVWLTFVRMPRNANRSTRPPDPPR